MVSASPALTSPITHTVDNLAVLPTASWFRPLSADAIKMDGLNVHFAAVDEVHEHHGPDRRPQPVGQRSETKSIGWSAYSRGVNATAVSISRG